MVGERLVNVIKSAAEVNLRYSAITLKLAREYIKEFDGVVRNGVTGRAEPGPAEPATASASPPERRPPILIVGQAGSEATGAFVLNNTADTDLTVGLVVQGDLGPVQAEIVPASLIIAPGDSAVVQLKVAMTDAMEPGRDYFGAVVAPGLSAQAIEFVVRRLPGGGPAKPARKARASPRRAGG